MLEVKCTFICGIIREQCLLCTQSEKKCVLPFVEILWCCSTLLPPPLNNRFGLIGQLLVPPPYPKKTAILLPLQSFHPVSLPQRSAGGSLLFSTCFWRGCEWKGSNCWNTLCWKRSHLVCSGYIPPRSIPNRWQKWKEQYTLNLRCLFIHLAPCLSFLLCFAMLSTQATVSQK